MHGWMNGRIRDIHRNYIFGNQDANPEGTAPMNKRASTLSVGSSKDPRETLSRRGRERWRESQPVPGGKGLDAA